MKHRVALLLTGAFVGLAAPAFAQDDCFMEGGCTTVAPGAQERIDEHGYCRLVTNNTDDPLMVPHANLEEWVPNTTYGGDCGANCQQSFLTYKNEIKEIFDLWSDQINRSILMEARQSMLSGSSFTSSGFSLSPRLVSLTPTHWEEVDPEKPDVEIALCLSETAGPEQGELALYDACNTNTTITGDGSLTGSVGGFTGFNLSVDGTGTASTSTSCDETIEIAEESIQPGTQLCVEDSSGAQSCITIP
jgi:hypothetical protein